MTIAIDRPPMRGTALGSSFEPHRGALRGLAYRMLGDLAAAEDAVQEAYIRWHRADRAGIVEPRAWLLTTCARLCIDELRSARARRETYVGPWLPEPLMEPEIASDPVERSESLSIAFLLLLDQLGPIERAAYVLREVFDLDYREIARSLGKTAAACRQIVSRASRRLAAAEPPTRPDEMTTAAFAAALSTGDMAGLVRLLAGDAVLLSDGGGKVVSALNPIRGAARAARLLLGIRRKIGPDVELQAARINGGPGLVMQLGARVIGVVGFAAGISGIAAIYIVRNPDKLARIAARRHGASV